MAAAGSSTNTNSRTPRRSGCWSSAEDQRLLDLRQGDRNWAEISRTLPERSIEACKQRFKKLRSRSLTQNGGLSQQG